MLHRSHVSVRDQCSFIDAIRKNTLGKLAAARSVFCVLLIIMDGSGEKRSKPRGAGNFGAPPVSHGGWGEMGAAAECE
jgi:hypothetical protein